MQRSDRDRGSTYRILLLAATVGMAAPALAQEPRRATELSLDELMAIEVPMVSTPSRRAEPATHAPGTVIVIDQRDIRMRGYANLVDVLRDLPGMETVDDYFTEIGTLAPVRGISGNNKIVVLLDGMRVNPPGGEFFPFRNDFSVRQAEQIEIIYGPGSTLYGQDAISAVINVKTRGAEPERTVELGVGGGLEDSFESWGAFGKAFGESQISGYVQYFQSDPRDLDETFPAYWSAYEAVAAPKGSGSPPSRDDFGLNIQGRIEVGDSSSIQVWHRQSRRSSSEGFSPALGFVSEARWEDLSTVAEAKNTLAFDDDLRLTSALTYNRYEISPDSRYVFPASETEWFLDDFKYGISTGIDLEETLHWNATDDLLLIAGIEVGTYDIVPKSTVPGGADTDSDIGSQGGSFVYFEERGVPESRREIQRVVGQNYEVYSGYFEGAWQILDELRLIAGLRITKDERFSELPLTPRAALIYDITEKLTAKYIFTRAYVQPAAYFGFATFDNGAVLNSSNPDLEPETAIMNELDLNWTDERFSIGVSAYYGKQDDLILVADRALPENVIREEVYVDLEGSGTRQLVNTVNGGESQNIGVDVYGRFQLGSLQGWYSYSFVDFEEDTDTGTTGLRAISHHNGRLGATWAITDSLFVTPSLAIRSTPKGVDGGELDAELDTPWQIDLHALWAVTEWADLFLDVQNLTDHRYALGGITGDAIPQPALRGLLGTRLSF